MFRCQRGRSSSTRFPRDLHGSGTSMLVYHSSTACVPFLFAICFTLNLLSYEPYVCVRLYCHVWIWFEIILCMPHCCAPGISSQFYAQGMHPLKLNPYASHIYVFWLIIYYMSCSLSTCCAFVYKCKIMLCTHLGGATQSLLYVSCKILVLSSNTKKGEIERAHFTSLWFCVLANNTRIHFT